MSAGAPNSPTAGRSAPARRSAPSAATIAIEKRQRPAQRNALVGRELRRQRRHQTAHPRLDGRGAEREDDPGRRDRPRPAPRSRVRRAPCGTSAKRPLETQAGEQRAADRDRQPEADRVAQRASRATSRRSTRPRGLKRPSDRKSPAATAPQAQSQRPHRRAAAGPPRRAGEHQQPGIEGEEERRRVGEVLLRPRSRPGAVDRAGRRGTAGTIRRPGADRNSRSCPRWRE